MPWSKKQRRLQMMPQEKEVDLEKMFEIVKHDVSSLVCAVSVLTALLVCSFVRSCGGGE